MPPRSDKALLGIGSSQIAALVNLHPYRTKLDVFNELALGVKQRARDFMDWGQYQEPAILAYRARQLGCPESGSPWTEQNFRDEFGARWLGGTTVQSAESSIALASPDAIFYLDNGDAEQIEEGKNVGEYESADWGEADDAAPAGYQLQNLWQQGCTGIHRGEIVASIGGRAPAAWPVRWDAEVWGHLLTIAERFWRDHVLMKRPPVPIDGSDSATDYLRARYPAELQPMAGPAPADLVEQALEWEQVNAWANATEKREKDLRNAICDRIGEGSGYTLPDGRWLTWRAQKNGHGGTSRVLRIQKAKKGA